MYACPWNDDDGRHNAYMKKIRLDILEDADGIDQMTQAMLAWGYGFEKKLMQAKAGVNLEGDPAAQTFASEWKQLKYDFDSYMGEVSDSNRIELDALWKERGQFDQRLAELPQIKVPHYPKPPKPTAEAPDKPPEQPGQFVARGAHPVVQPPRSDGSIEPPDARGVVLPIRR